MIDGPSSHPLTTSERFSILHARRASWRKLKLGSRETSIHLRGHLKSYEFAGGYLGRVFWRDQTNAHSDAQNYVLVALPSGSPHRQETVDTYDIGFSIGCHAFDSSQDLLVLSEIPSLHTGVRIHPRRLSKPSEKHPAATVIALTVMAGLFSVDYELYVADDAVAFFIRDASLIIIFNWRTGEELVVRAFYHLLVDLSTDQLN